MTDFNMKASPVCWEIELFEDDGRDDDEYEKNQGRLVIRACGGQLDWSLTAEEEIKLAKHLYNKHVKSGVAWV